MKTDAMDKQDMMDEQDKTMMLTDGQTGRRCGDMQDDNASRQADDDVQDNNTHGQAR